MARVHRIGQTKPVSVFRLITEGTVEERIFQRAQKKLFLDSVVTRGSSAASEGLEGLDSAALLASLRFGADGVFANAEGAPPTEAELEALCDRTDDGAARRAALSMAVQHGARSAADFAGELAQAPLSALLLQGKDHAEARAEARSLRAQRQLQGSQELERGSRQRMATTVEVDGYTVLKVRAKAGPFPSISRAGRAARRDGPCCTSSFGACCCVIL